MDLFVDVWDDSGQGMKANEGSITHSPHTSTLTVTTKRKEDVVSSIELRGKVTELMAVDSAHDIIHVLMMCDCYIELIDRQHNENRTFQTKWTSQSCLTRINVLTI
jgi:uncharacterized protein YjiK